MRRHNLSATCSVLVRFALGAIFLSAGIQKTIALHEFTAVLRWISGWNSLSALYWLGAIICAWEMTLGVFLITGAMAATTLLATIVTLLGFSAVLLVMMLDASAPASCGCGRLFIVFGEFSDSKVAGLIRNGLLCAGAFWLLLVEWRNRGIHGLSAPAEYPAIIPADER